MRAGSRGARRIALAGDDAATDGAVLAAKRQSLDASEALDRGRGALYGESRHQPAACDPRSGQRVRQARRLVAVNTGARALGAPLTQQGQWEDKSAVAAHSSLRRRERAEPGHRHYLGGRRGPSRTIEGDDPGRSPTRAGAGRISHGAAAPSPRASTAVRAAGPRPRRRVHRFLAGLVGPAEADDCLRDLHVRVRAYQRLHHTDNLRRGYFIIHRRRPIRPARPAADARPRGRRASGCIGRACRRSPAPWCGAVAAEAARGRDASVRARLAYAGDRGSEGDRGPPGRT